jgi:hypothetical protein
MATQTCPTCQGRGAVSNAKTGSPELCPNCQGQTTVSIGTDDLPFWYPFLPGPNSTTFALTALQANAGAQVVIDNDSDFLCDRLISNSTGAFNVFLIDRFTARPLMPSQAVPINSTNLFGTGQLPFWLPKPYLFRRTSTIQGFFTDTSGVGNTIQACLVGYKVA